MCLLRNEIFTRFDTSSIYFYNMIVKGHGYYIFRKYLIEYNDNIERYALQFSN
jgi:hypothetical protein